MAGNKPRAFVFTVMSPGETRPSAPTPLRPHEQPKEPEGQRVDPAAVRKRKEQSEQLCPKKPENLDKADKSSELHIF